LLAKHLSGAVKAGLCLTQAPSQYLRDLFITEVMEVPQDEHLTIFIRQMLLEIMKNAPLEFAFDNDPLRVVLVRRNPYFLKAERQMFGLAAKF
jgi:hypothetical protein